MRIYQKRKIDWTSPNEWVTIGLGLLFFAYFINFVVLGFLVSPYDWDHLSSYYELAWRFWISSPGLPEYNPYFCGGQTLGGDPQLPIFHPLVLLVPILGGSWVIKLEMFFQLYLGTWGLRRWLKTLGIDESGCRWGMLLFIGGGAAVAKFFVGHETLGFFFLLPLFFYLATQFEDPKRRKKAIFAYVGLAVYCGLYKPNFLVQGVPLLAIEHFFSALRRPLQGRRLLKLFVLVGACFFCGLVNAAVYLPTWKYFSEFPRHGFPLILVPPYTLLASLLMPLKTIPYVWYGPGTVGRHEYSVFLGPVAVIIAGLGFRRWKLSPDRPAVLALILSTAVLGIGALSGEWSWIFPHTWFAHLWPGYHSVRVATRAWFGVYLGVVVLSAYGWRSWERRKVKWAIIVLGIIPLLISAGINLFKPTVFARFTQWAIAREFPPEIFWVKGSYDNTFQYIRKGQGVIECMFNIDTYRQVPFEPGPSLPSIRGLDIRWKSWNRIAVRGTLRNLPNAPVIPFHLNYSPYWSVEGEGLAIRSKLGELLTLGATRQRVDAELVFRQPYIQEGIYISILGILAFLGVGWFTLRAGEPLARTSRD